MAGSAHTQTLARFISASRTIKEASGELMFRFGYTEEMLMAASRSVKPHRTAMYSFAQSVLAAAARRKAKREAKS